MFISKLLSAAVEQVNINQVFGISLEISFVSKFFNVLALYRFFVCNINAFLVGLKKYYDGVNKDTMCVLLGDIRMYLLKPKQFLTVV